MLRATTLVALSLAVLCLGASSEPCDPCHDRFDGRVEAGARARHQTLVQAGREYVVTLAPTDANADLVVSADGEWPPDVILCRSAKGGTAVDRCEFDATSNGPIYVFVLGGELSTGYVASLAKP
jgi:hypothetical protein